MLDCDGIDVSQVIDIHKTNDSHKCKVILSFFKYI